MAYALGQDLQRENGYGGDPIPPADEWENDMDPGCWAAILSDDRNAIGLLVVEQATSALPYRDWLEGASPRPWSGPLISFAYISPSHRGRGIYRNFLAEVLAGAKIADTDVAHLPPFSVDATRFHRLDLCPESFIVGWNWRHGDRPTQFSNEPVNHVSGPRETR